MRPAHVVTVAVLALVVLVFVSGYDAFTASSTVAASKVQLQKSTFNLADLEPNECTVTVTSLKAGTGHFNATATNQLVLGSSSADTVTLMKNDCFVGGKPTTGGTYDNVTGALPSAGNGDQCIVTARATTTRCTVVATRP